jgi:beta-glucanase (GH16 family)
LRVEAKIKMPQGGLGIWPAFWMLPARDTYGIWPRSGEIDIVETSVDMSVALASTHFIKAPQYTVGWKADVEPGFNVYSVDWTPYSLEFACNGEVYHMATVDDWSDDKQPRPFDQPFQIKLNLAVGGAFPGDPTDQTPFPQHMDVEWVRVWSL